MRPLLLLTAALAFAAAGSETWRFNSLKRIGGHAVTVEGSPRVDHDSIVFDGIHDALFLDVHPLAGARQWTWEVIFRPDPGGRAEQRFFHLQETGTATRMLFEIRLANNEWWLDSYAHHGEKGQALIDPKKRHPVGRWYAVEAVYDGRTYRNYVNGILQNEAAIALSPQSTGRTSIGTRINRVDYFKGAVRLSRFTRRALPPTAFLKAPPPNF
jgi:hypothetical protein